MLSRHQKVTEDLGRKCKFGDQELDRVKNKGSEATDSTWSYSAQVNCGRLHASVCALHQEKGLEAPGREYLKPESSLNFGKQKTLPTVHGPWGREKMWK